MTLANRLRSALARDCIVPPLAGDTPEDRASASVKAAVLVGITDRAEPGIILTVRRENMRTHAGQVAFPGGRIDQGEDAVGAALREAWEELGLDPKAAEVVGELDPYRTITNYVVTPVLAVVVPTSRCVPTSMKLPTGSKRRSPSFSIHRTSTKRALCSRDVSATTTRSCGMTAGSGERRPR
jgi:ADP-ribose pyrophosphatase YjhB (NUDIX family)